MRQRTSPRKLASDVKAFVKSERSTDSTFPRVEAVDDVFRRLGGAQTSDRQDARPLWIPGDFARLGRGWWDDNITWYVVVDDIEGDTSLLAVSAWPHLDARRRLTFNSHLKHGISVKTNVLASFLGTLRTSVVHTDTYAALASPIAGDEMVLRVRPPRIGDTFAFSDSALQVLQEPQTDFVSETPDAFSLDQSVVVLDLTGAAREQAKIAFYAAASRSIDPRREGDSELAETIWAERAALEDKPLPEQYA